MDVFTSLNGAPHGPTGYPATSGGYPLRRDCSCGFAAGRCPPTRCRPSARLLRGGRLDRLTYLADGLAVTTVASLTVSRQR